MIEKYKKVYVRVNIDVDQNGNVRPKSITWTDGKIYEIDRLKSIQKAASRKVGGCGMRYGVSIEGFDRYIFEEDGRWFVEARIDNKEN